MKILVIAPHLDDECWSAALLVRHLYMADTVSILSLSHAGYRHVSNDAIMSEHNASVDILREHGKVKQITVCLEPYTMSDNSTELRQAIWNVIHDEKPDLVLVPAMYDCHPDHQAARTAGIAVAWKTEANIFGYLVPGNSTRQVQTQRAIVTHADMQVKQAMIDCYKSQRFRGQHEAGTEERFEIVRMGI